MEFLLNNAYLNRAGTLYLHYYSVILRKKVLCKNNKSNYYLKMYNII